MLAFSLLGSFRIETEDGPLVAALPRRCVSLVGYILLHRPERIYRERLAAALWPDAPDAEARGKLRRHLYLIGQALPQAKRDDWFLFDTTTVAWNPAVSATTDVESVREAVRAERWQVAVDRYGGELLAGCDDEWLCDERERFRDAHVTSLERLALQERAAGSLPAAIAAAQELLRLEPWREAAVRVLIEARQAMGDRAGALAEYERFSARLRDDLDVEPMAETTALYTDLIRRKVPLESVAPLPLPSSPAGQSVLPFVGREAQIATLREAWSRAEQQRGCLAFVGGESGVGKTRLAGELAAHVARSGGTVLRGGTTFIETSPYQALAEALRSTERLAELAATAPWRSALAAMLPELQREDAQEPAVLGPEAERSRLFEAVVAGLRSLADARPLLLVLEDLHWAGSATVALLAHVARRVVHERIAIVATYRDDDLPRAHPLRDLRRQLGREGTACVVSLGPLTASDVERFFTLRFGDASAATSLRYHEATDGLPLFLVELLADVTNGRTLPVLPATALPQSLAATIERRLRDLSPAARAAMEIAAVIGAGFDLELVAEASGWSDAETLRHVGDLIERHVVRELPGSGAGYAFAHAFYRENAYAQIPMPKRRERHARVARALAELYPGRLGDVAPELARHYEEAGDVARAIVHLTTSARRASALLANEDTLAYTERALMLGPAPANELELRLLREEAHRRSGRRAAQRDELERASALAERLADRDAEYDVVYRRIALAHEIGERDLERSEIRRAEALAERPGSAWPAKLALARAKHHGRLSEHREARTHFEFAARRFEAVDDPRGAFDSYIGLAEVERISENLQAVERCFDLAERQVTRCDDSRALVMRLYEERANFAFFRQAYAQAEVWARLFCEAAEATGDFGSRARAYMLLGSASAWCFDIVTARAHLAQAAQLFEAIGDRHHVYAVGYEFGLLAVWLGDFDEAIHRFTQASLEAEALGYAYGQGACSISLGHAWALAGDARRAEEQARRAIEFAKRLDAESLLAPGLVNLGMALLQRGMPLEAQAPLEEGCRLGERAGRADLVAEASTFLCSAYARTDRFAAALAAASEMRRRMDPVAPALRSGGRYWIVAEALQRAGYAAEAAEALAEGRAVVQAQLERIPDDVSRRTFAALPTHRALLAGPAPDARSDAFRTVFA